MGDSAGYVEVGDLGSSLPFGQLPLNREYRVHHDRDGPVNAIVVAELCRRE